MLPLTYCRKTVVKGGMVSHVGYHDTISVKFAIMRNFFGVLFFGPISWWRTGLISGGVLKCLCYT